METLESSRVCRLCGKQSGISINIFDKNENHVKKINAILPIMVHEMDLLPKHMCHRCSYKLEEFHKFYVDCLKTDANLKSQLSWMRKEGSNERVGVPMVHIENIKMKVEPPDNDAYDANPIVDNVGYISSVTFPVNGVQSNEIPERITYTAYARCGCYCDKADQSNQPVPANYDNRISRCSSIRSNVKPHSHSCANRLAIVPDFPHEVPEKSSVLRFNDNDRKPRNSTSSTLSPSKIKSNKVKRASKKTRVVRNLRPRRASVDYVGRRKKLAVSGDKSNRSMNVTGIKTEELNHFHGHMLRPRKGFVDYIGPKRKYCRSATKNQRSRSDEDGSAENKVRNIASKLKLPSKEVANLWKSRVKVNVKTEQLTDVEETTLDETISSAVLSLSEDSDVKNQIETLPNFTASQQDDRVNLNAFDYPRSSDGRFLSADSNWKPLRSVSKSKSKSEKIKLNRANKTNTYPSKCLRSQNSCLRNGKIIKMDNGEASRKLRKSLRNLPSKGRTMGRNLMQAIRGTVAERNMSASSTKLIEIKQYCERCNSSFVNKELFKLHACYGHSFYLHNRG